MTINNPTFKTLSYKEITWTQAVRGKYPWGHSTSCCPKRIKEGEIVITIPFWRSTEHIGTVVCHQRCLVKFLAKVPDDMSLIEEKVEEIKKEFIR